MFKLAFDQFLGSSPDWFKMTILVFIVASYPMTLVLGETFTGWMFVLMFILTLAMALKCYPLQSGGILAITALLLGLTNPQTVWSEIQQNLPVIMLLVFMVSFIYFMRESLVYLFGKLLLRIRSRILLMLMFSFAAAFLSAFLDALTVTAVLITVLGAMYRVYERIHSSIGNEDRDHDGVPDHIQLGGETLDQFRAFIRSVMMHGAVGTALGGVCTIVGEPQNLLIGQKMGWEFVPFVLNMAHVTVPAVTAGLITCVIVEKLRWFGYGQDLPDDVRDILSEYLAEEDAKRSPKQWYAIKLQGIAGMILILGLAFHIMEVGLLGLMLLVLVTAANGITEEHQIGRAFEESLPFVALLCIFFVIVGMIHDLHLFSPVINWVLTLPIEDQPQIFFLANGALSAISDNVFVATVYINEVEAAFNAGEISREHFEALAVAINTGTNLPSVATPNGQAAFLFLLTSSLAPLIRLAYMRMVWMALPYTIVLTIVGFLVQ